ncbi:MAG: hypothetical protein ABSE96_15085 [Terracidiphilus sp.]|jgi:hypothetical protein
MKRIRIPGIVDIVSSDNAAEIEVLAQDLKLDRAYADRSIPVNGKILQRVQDTLQIGGKPFPTVAPRCAEGRATAQDALWKRLNAMAPAYAAGPDKLESLAAFVRGEGSAEMCGPLVQQVVGTLFAPNFKATEDSWNAALVLDQAPRTMNLALLVWWALTKKVDRAKQLLSDMVGGDLAAVHAIGVALHNIVSGVNLMRELYSDPSSRTALSPEVAGNRCLFAPTTVLRQPTDTDSSANGELATGTLVLLNLQAANAKTPNAHLAFLRKTWSQCPAEQWVPALLEGIWLRACNPQEQGKSAAGSRS